jgi:hypothetical protein
MIECPYKPFAVPSFVDFSAVAYHAMVLKLQKG